MIKWLTTSHHSAISDLNPLPLYLFGFFCCILRCWGWRPEALCMFKCCPLTYTPSTYMKFFKVWNFVDSSLLIKQCCVKERREETSKQMQCMGLHWPGLEETNYRQILLRELRRSQYEDSIRWYLVIVINFVRCKKVWWLFSEKKIPKHY